MTDTLTPEAEPTTGRPVSVEVIEKKTSPLKKSLRVGAALAILVSPIAFVWSWHRNERNEIKSDQRADEKADRLQRCLNFVNLVSDDPEVRVVVNFDSIPKAEKEACGLPQEIDMSDSQAMWELKNSAGFSFKDGSRIEAVDTTYKISLPSAESLADEIGDLRDEANDKNALAVAGPALISGALAGGLIMVSSGFVGITRTSV